MSDLIIVKAKIKVLTAEEGGKRRTPFVSGYRPDHVFEVAGDDNIVAYMGDIRFHYPEIYPGDEKEVTVRFLKSLQLNKYLHIGNKWRIQEGGNLIAIAEILELL